MTRSRITRNTNQPLNMADKAIISTLNEAYFSANPHEREVIALMPKLLRGLQVFVDVGASLGQFTKAASQSLRGGTILAVEADPLRHRQLEKNCQEWAAASGNSIRAVHGAASNMPGTLKFQITNSSVSGGRVPTRPRPPQPGIPAQRHLDGSVRASGDAGRTARGTRARPGQDGHRGCRDSGARRGNQAAARGANTNWLIELHDFTDPLGRKPTEVVPPMMEKLGIAQLSFATSMHSAETHGAPRHGHISRRRRGCWPDGSSGH